MGPRSRFGGRVALARRALRARVTSRTEAALDGSREITWTEASTCPRELKEQVLLFDWWVRNEDRSLNEERGNPNLLVTGGGIQSQFWVFDFNLAFDPTFSIADFWRYHIFTEMVPDWRAEFRESMIPTLRSIASQVGSHFQMLPPEWKYLDGEDGVVPALGEDEVRVVLSRLFDDPEGFWSRA